jgi:hypothetical protein
MQSKPTNYYLIFSSKLDIVVNLYSIHDILCIDPDGHINIQFQYYLSDIFSIEIGSLNLLKYQNFTL